MKATAINDVILAVVAAMVAAVDYPVFDGPPSKRPGRDVDRWLAIGAEDVDDPANPTQSAKMEAAFTSLGMVVRTEDLHIDCVAVGKASTIALARNAAAAVVEDASQNLPHAPSAQSYAAHVSAVSAMHSYNTAGGAVVQIQFTISANARLT